MLVTTTELSKFWDTLIFFPHMWGKHSAVEYIPRITEFFFLPCFQISCWEVWDDEVAQHLNTNMLQVLGLINRTTKSQ